MSPAVIPKNRAQFLRRSHISTTLPARLGFPRTRLRSEEETEGVENVGEHAGGEIGKGADTLRRRREARCGALTGARKMKCPMVVAKLDRERL